MEEATGAITLEEFLNLPDDGYRDEVSRGYLVREPQPGDQHGAIAVELVTILNNWLKEHPSRKAAHSQWFPLEPCAADDSWT